MTLLDLDPDHRNSMARNIQTVITGLVLAAVVWVGQTVSDSRVEIAYLRERIDQFSRRMDELAADRYRAAEAQRDFALRDQLLQRLEQRVSRLEENLEHHNRPEGGKR